MEYPQRKKLRLQGYDYSSNGMYFVTICTQDRLPLFGRIVVGAGFHPRPRVEFSEYGKYVQSAIEYSDLNYHQVLIDKYVIMPNHIHMIIVLHTPTDGNGTPPIHAIIGRMKSFVAKQAGFSFWQRSFHDRIIKNEKEYALIWKSVDIGKRLFLHARRTSKSAK